MMRRILRSRAWRKFFRNKLAIVASCFIGLYALIFVCVVGSQLTDLVGLTKFEVARATKERVLPPQWPGFLEEPDLEKRYDALDWQIGAIERVLRRSYDSPESFRTALEPLHLAERKVLDLPKNELEILFEGVQEAFEAVDEAYGGYDEALEYLYDDLDALEEAREEDDSAEIASLEDGLDARQAAVDTARGELDQRIADTEVALETVMPMPTGFAGVRYGFRTFMGSDVLGQSIAVRSFYSIKIAFQVGLVVAIVSVVIGTALGSMAGFFGGWIDNAVMWLVSVFSSIPYLVLLAVIAFMFTGHPIFDNPAEYPELQLVKLYTAMGLTFWVGTARVIRGEVMKIKELEYVQAASAIGFGRFYIVLKHVVPNTFHIMFINFSLLFIGAIKNEVILSFLGLGVSGQPSWGTMISNAKDDLSNYFFWEVGAASFLMFGLVLAFNIVSDALQDAFDPKHV